jgi:hypothetical protein
MAAVVRRIDAQAATADRGHHAAIGERAECVMVNLPSTLLLISAG